MLHHIQQQAGTCALEKFQEVFLIVWGILLTKWLTLLSMIITQISSFSYPEYSILGTVPSPSNNFDLMPGCIPSCLHDVDAFSHLQQ